MRSRTGTIVALVASVVLVVVAAAAWGMQRTSGVGEDLARTAGPTPAQAAATPSPTPSVPPAPPFPDVPVTDATQIAVPSDRPSPARMDIPSVGISMPVQATGVAPDGQMELPDDPQVIGWYRFGPLPGDPSGSAVLGGHVDSVEYGVGPLSRLASVQPGAEVTVTAADGQVLRYQVRSVERIYKAALPLDQVFAPDGAPQLTVITCGGRFLGTGRGYEDNIVAVADPVPGATP